MQPSLESIVDDFELLDEWEDRYRYIIDLGKALEPLPEADHTEANKVQGCVSQVWLRTDIGDGADPMMQFTGDSDAHIVRGLVALVLAIFSGKRASQVLAEHAAETLSKLGLDQHLSPQRSNGLNAMIGRIRREAELAIARQG